MEYLILIISLGVLVAITILLFVTYQTFSYGREIGKKEGQTIGYKEGCENGEKVGNARKNLEYSTRNLELVKEILILTNDSYKDFESEPAKSKAKHHLLCQGIKEIHDRHLK